MSVTARIGGAGGAWRAAGDGERVPAVRAVARWLTAALAVVALVLGAGAAGLGLYASAHTDRIYEGVEVAGVRVGGMTAAEARAAVEARFAAYAGQPLTLTAGEAAFGLTPAAAGARLDGAATVEAAFGYGRTGSLWERSRAWARGLVRGATVAPRVVVDGETAARELAAIAPEVVRAPVDAAVRIEGASEPALVPDAPGVAFDLGATRAALTARVAALGTEPVAIVTRSVPAAVPAAALAPRLPEARAAVGSALVLSTDEGVWHVPDGDLKRIVSVDAEEAALRVDRRSLTALVEGLAGGIDREAVDAGITVDGNGALAATPAVAMARVEVERTVDAIEAALLAGEHDVPLVVERAAPAIGDEAAAAAAAAGERLIEGGMELTWSGGRARLGRNDLLRALTIAARPGEREPFRFGLDEAVVAELLAPVTERVDEPAVDARFRIVDGQIRVASEAMSGRALDVEKGLGAVVAAFGKTEPEVRFEVDALRPRYTAADLDQIRLGDDLLAEASTYYGQSSEPRRRNVERVVELESGWLVPPDGVFSYVENVGAVDAGNGFVTGFGIVADEGGGVTTAPVIGGGICQVSTTLFQAAFWAGMPIVERYQHPYYLRSYGEAPQGLPGLDAMVNIEEDWAIDFKFRNATDDWLAVVLIADGENVSARLVGTAPGWEVQVGQPEVSNLVTRDQKMYFTESPELPRGQELLVESAEDGFDVTIGRTVSKEGRVLFADEVVSSFSPARNLTLRGTGG